MFRGAQARLSRAATIPTSTRNCSRTFPFERTEVATKCHRTVHESMRKCMNVNINCKLFRFRIMYANFTGLTSRRSATSMATSSPKTSVVLPIDSLSFTLLPFAYASNTEDETSPRLGVVHFPHRTAISTPHYIGLTSRGTVPHLSQDMMRDHTSISGVYAALEDCMFLNVSRRLTPYFKSRVWITNDFGSPPR